MEDPTGIGVLRTRSFGSQSIHNCVCCSSAQLPSVELSSLGDPIHSRIYSGHNALEG